MKRSTIMICALIVILSGTSVYANASRLLEVASFPVKLVFNQEERPIPDEYTILNYNGHTYVPIRMMADYTSSGIYYNNNENLIEYESFPDSIMAAHSNEAKSDDFTLKIYSEKETFSHKEVPHIWSEFTYEGSQDRKVYHSSPLITYTIKDGKGNSYEQARYSVSDVTTFNKHSSYRTDLKPKTFELFNFRKSGLVNYDDFANSGIHPWHLEKGDYEVTATARYQNDSSQETINATLVIHAE